MLKPTPTWVEKNYSFLSKGAHEEVYQKILQVLIKNKNNMIQVKGSHTNIHVYQEEEENTSVTIFRFYQNDPETVLVECNRLRGDRLTRINLYRQTLVELGDDATPLVNIGTSVVSFTPLPFPDNICE